MNPVVMLDEAASAVVDCEVRCATSVAQLVRLDMPTSTRSTFVDPENYLVDMSLTPRPLEARGCYRQRWEPHRLERLGAVFVVPPGEEMLFSSGSGRQAALRCQLDRRAINSLVGRELIWPDHRLAGTVDLTGGKFRSLLDCLVEELYNPGLGASRMLEFITGALALELARYCLNEDKRLGIGGLAGWQLRLIDDRLAEDRAPPSLDDLASLCSISTRQLSRGFKASRGCAIGEYVLRRSMETAQRLLMSGEPVKSVAFAVGYSSPSSFSFAFQRAVGANPRQFRQRQSRGLQGVDRAS